MTTQRDHARYVRLALGAMLLALGAVVALNYPLVERSAGGARMVTAASLWQQSTKGVTYAPPLNANQPFKAARIHARMPEINTVVFGSSTMMGITQDMFPADMRLYNFAQTGNALPTAIGEARALHRGQPAAFRLFVLPLDWALGFVYESRPPPDIVFPLSPPAFAARETKAALRNLADALSLPRVRNLLRIIGGIMRSRDPAAVFRETFLQESGDEYRCADGTPAKDFDTIFRGTCTGFRYDGSATFANLTPVAARRAPTLIASALVPSSKYVARLAEVGGEPDRGLLDAIGALAAALRQQGGDVILLLPPLLPGMERAFLDGAATGGPLGRTKQALDVWSRRNRLVVIDAGQSERYGCGVEEFVDEHHALPQCYARVFTRFWNDARGLERPGLWSGG